MSEYVDNLKYRKYFDIDAETRKEVAIAIHRVADALEQRGPPNKIDVTKLSTENLSHLIVTCNCYGWASIKDDETLAGRFGCISCVEYIYELRNRLGMSQDIPVDMCEG